MWGGVIICHFKVSWFFFNLINIFSFFRLCVCCVFILLSFSHYGKSCPLKPHYRVTKVSKSYILILLSVCDGARVRHRRLTGPSPALPDFHRPSLSWGVPGWVRHRRPVDSLVLCTGGTGTAVLWFSARVAGTAILWFPTRAVRARPFSGS
jgi:hypothetical protein